MGLNIIPYYCSEMEEALARESERRGVKTSTVIREALETVFKPMINRAA
jgi:hypothetical protein